jgi:hypothetical protein
MLVYLMATYFITIGYILRSFGVHINPVLVSCTQKNLATLILNVIFESMYIFRNKDVCETQQN